jgi:hypothetical protein
MAEENADCVVEEPVEALVIPGSSYKGVYRIGSRVALELEESTGKVVVTRGAGAIKVAYVIGQQVPKIEDCLRKGYGYAGKIVEVGLGPAGKILHLKLDPPIYPSP